MNKAKQETSDDLTKVPNLKYAKLFEQFKEIETLPLEQWKAPHILGYICRKFKETFGVDYVFKFNNPLPSKSFEMWQVKALSGKLSSQPTILKAYIDWAYIEKAKTAKRKPTSISFLTQDEYTNKYKWLILNNENKMISRSDILPPKYSQILLQINIVCSTYGDLSFLYHSIKDGDLLTNNHYIMAFDLLVKSGLDLTLLDKII